MDMTARQQLAQDIVNGLDNAGNDALANMEFEKLIKVGLSDKQIYPDGRLARLDDFQEFFEMASRPDAPKSLNVAANKLDEAIKNHPKISEEGLEKYEAMRLKASMEGKANVLNEKSGFRSSDPRDMSGRDFLDSYKKAIDAGNIQPTGLRELEEKAAQAMKANPNHASDIADMMKDMAEKYPDLNIEAFKQAAQTVSVDEGRFDKILQAQKQNLPGGDTSDFARVNPMMDADALYSSAVQGVSDAMPGNWNTQGTSVIVEGVFQEVLGDNPTGPVSADQVQQIQTMLQDKLGAFLKERDMDPDFAEDLVDNAIRGFGDNLSQTMVQTLEQSGHPMADQIKDAIQKISDAHGGNPTAAELSRGLSAYSASFEGGNADLQAFRSAMKEIFDDADKIVQPTIPLKLADTAATAQTAEQAGITAGLLNKLGLGRLAANLPVIGGAIGAATLAATSASAAEQREAAQEMMENGEISQEAYQEYIELNQQVQGILTGDIAVSTADPTGISIFASIGAEAVAAEMFQKWADQHNVSPEVYDTLKTSLFNGQSSGAEFYQAAGNMLPDSTQGQPEVLHDAIAGKQALEQAQAELAQIASQPGYAEQREQAREAVEQAQEQFQEALRETLSSEEGVDAVLANLDMDDKLEYAQTLLKSDQDVSDFPGLQKLKEAMELTGRSGAEARQEALEELKANPEVLHAYIKHRMGVESEDENKPGQDHDQTAPDNDVGEDKDYASRGVEQDGDSIYSPGVEVHAGPDAATASDGVVRLGENFLPEVPADAFATRQVGGEYENIVAEDLAGVLAGHNWTVESQHGGSVVTFTNENGETFFTDAETAQAVVGGMDDKVDFEISNAAGSREMNPDAQKVMQDAVPGSGQDNDAEHIQARDGAEIVRYENTGTAPTLDADKLKEGMLNGEGGQLTSCFQYAAHGVGTKTVDPTATFQPLQDAPAAGQSSGAPSEPKEALSPPMLG